MEMETKGNIQVQFSPAPEHFFDNLTADIQTADCIFDLIDNSIDAAKATIADAHEEGLGADYRGFEIKLNIESTRVSIKDNCSGIDEGTFSNTAFRSGLRSQHSYGIGHFGVGMKRAIFKLGTSCSIETDDGKTFISLRFTRQQFELADGLTLPAIKGISTGKKFTSICIENAPEDIMNDLGSVRWMDTLVENIGRRYGLFIRKGLAIEVNAERVTAFAPQPAENPYFSLLHEKFKSHGVEVEIIAGVHEEYRFGKNSKGVIGADPENLPVHKRIAKEFGWYIVCNDRVIILHDQTFKTGWSTNWHNEYAGFVGWVHFRSKDPSLLPWNTRKNDIKDNSAVYLDVLDRLNSMTQVYRQNTPLATERRKKNTIEAKVSQKPACGKSTAKALLSGVVTKKKLNSIETLLPSDVAFASQQPRLAGLVVEAEKIEIAAYPYSCAILLRTLFDAALRDFLKRHSRFVEMRDAVLDSKREEVQNLTAKERKTYSPLLSDMVVWCINNADVFPDPHVRTCKTACALFSKNLKWLNGIAHEDGSISNPGRVKLIRDDVLQGLLHILGS